MIPDAILQIPCLMTLESIRPCPLGSTMFPLMPCSIAGAHIISVSHVYQPAKAVIPIPILSTDPQDLQPSNPPPAAALNPSIHNDDLSGTVPCGNPACYLPFEPWQEAIVRSGRTLLEYSASGAQRRAKPYGGGKGRTLDLGCAKRGDLNHTERYMQNERDGGKEKGNHRCAKRGA